MRTLIPPHHPCWKMFLSCVSILIAATAWVCLPCDATAWNKHSLVKVFNLAATSLYVLPL